VRRLRGDLGPLEQVVMDHLWDASGPRTVREVFDDVGKRRRLAYTTVMTVMDRLRRKGLLRRTKVGRAFAYEATGSRGEYDAGLVRRILAASRDRRSVLLGFVRAVDEEELAELERIVRRAQRDRRSGSG
jgi:predicted transcriptional regulator